LQANVLEINGLEAVCRYLLLLLLQPLAQPGMNCRLQPAQSQTFTIDTLSSWDHQRHSR
jgi:hypothetical protein